MLHYTVDKVGERDLIGRILSKSLFFLVNKSPFFLVNVALLFKF